VSDEAISLELIMRQYERILAELRSFREEMRSFRDEMLVQGAMMQRLDREREHRDERDADMLNQMRAMVRQHQGFSDRLLAPDGRVRTLEDERR